MKNFSSHLKKTSTLSLLIFFIFTISSSISLAQSAPNYPTNKNELAQRIFSNWSQISSETIDGILFSDTNLEVRRFVEAIVLGESSAVLDAHLRNMKLDESSQERILVQLVEELRRKPESLLQLHRDIKEFNEYQPFREAKGNLGTGAFNSAILTIDFTAIWFGTAGAAGSLAQDFVQSYQVNGLFTAVMMLVGSGIVAEVINMKRSARDLVHEWKKKRKKTSLVKKIQAELANTTLTEEDEKSHYRESREIESAASEILPHLLAKMNKDALSSWRARRKMKAFTKRLKSTFSAEDLERMGLYDFKKLSKLRQFQLKVPILRWFIKEASDIRQVDVSDLNAYRRSLTRLSSINVELRDTTRKTNFFLLNPLSISLITVASAVQGLSLAVNSAAPGVINFDTLLGHQLLYLKHFEPIVTILTVGAIALSLDFQGMINSRRKAQRVRTRRRLIKQEAFEIQHSLTNENRSSFINNRVVRPAPKCSSFL